MHRTMTLGGALWINLANTVMMRDGKRTDGLEDPRFAVEWLMSNGLLTEAPEDKHAAGRMLAAVLPALMRLRDLCAGAISDLKRNGRLSDRTCADIAEVLRGLEIEVRMERRDGGFRLVHEGRSPADRASHAVIQSIADTLASHSPDRIRKCEHPSCILHFVDTSKSGRRRWCSMELCGNRQKAAEYYARQKKKSGG
ncbi:MAG: hypothetical protein C6W59_17780 [Paenibacillaceae bacterium]|nr:MAG: hypothetical protein C6W59_17780 [Paenibacillaceae bacterium]